MYKFAFLHIIFIIHELTYILCLILMILFHQMEMLSFQYILPKRFLEISVSVLIEYLILIYFWVLLNQ